MDDPKFRSQIEVLSVVDKGRRREWTDAEKVRIVEERLRGVRQCAVTARRYAISRALLTRWLWNFRSGRLVAGGRRQFLAVQVASHVTGTAGANLPPSRWAQACGRRRHRSDGAGTPGAGSGPGTIAFPAGAKVWIAGGVRDMRCGMNSLALKVPEPRRVCRRVVCSMTTRPYQVSSGLHRTPRRCCVTHA